MWGWGGHYCCSIQSNATFYFGYCGMYWPGVVWIILYYYTFYWGKVGLFFAIENIQCLARLHFILPGAGWVEFCSLSIFSVRTNFFVQ